MIQHWWSWDFDSGQAPIWMHLFHTEFALRFYVHWISRFCLVRFATSFVIQFSAFVWRYSYNITVDDSLFLVWIHL